MYYDDGSTILGFRGVEGDTSYNNWWAASWSYMYFGFLYDLCDEDSPPMSAAILSTFGVTVPPGATVPAQFLQQWLKLHGENNMLEMPYNTRGPIAALDNDTSGLSPYGNAGGDTIYRLREGIERFLITDINNPAASAKAQSEIFIMWDSVSTIPTDYNHVPGGSNVLYMDGHVSFMRYPGNDAPVTKSVALGMGALSSS
jgi:prepilin-type processing-associated H-X9-DG protein